MSKSRPSTRPPAQRSQATFRTSSVRNKDISSDSDDEDMDKNILNNRKNSKQVLLTELDDYFYNNDDSSFDSDDDDFLKPQKKVLNYKIYENNIENDKDYETDLEGMIY